MSDAAKRFFAWYEYPSGWNNGRHYRQGPYFTSWWKDIGLEQKRIHSLEELRKMPFNKTMAKRLESARPGTSIRVHSLSAGSDLYIERLTEDEYDTWIDFSEAKMNLRKVNEKITASIPKELSDEQKALEKEIKDLKKKHGWL